MTIPWISRKADRWLHNYAEYNRVSFNNVWMEPPYRFLHIINHKHRVTRWWEQRPWYVKVAEWLWEH